MSKLAAAIYGALAVSLTIGAAELALGRDLSGRHASLVNRAAKADRAVGVAGPAERTRTISLQPGGLSETSVLIRIPLATAARSRSSAPSSPGSSGTGKMAVACEPAVSVLTEIGRQLQPGRCVT